MLRTITYYNYYSNDLSFADEFKYKEQNDLALGFGNYPNGDYFDEDYEVFDYDSYTRIYKCKNSGLRIY